MFGGRFGRIILFALLLVAGLRPHLALAQTMLRPEELVKQAQKLEQEGNWQAARTNYLEALMRKPRYAEAEFRLGRLYLEHDSLQAAVQHLEAARALRYNEYEVARALGPAYFRLGRHAAAIEQYRAALALRPREGGLHAELAQVLYANDNLEQAWLEDSTSLALDPKNLLAHMLHGRILTRQREFDEARDEYRQVIASDPNYAEAYEALAELFTASGVDSAIQYYSRY
ncbi:MAG: tetratricopeptide repeat protein, partial [candidate division WOR-3 bacterium]